MENRVGRASRTAATRARRGCAPGALLLAALNLRLGLSLGLGLGCMAAFLISAAILKEQVDIVIVLLA